MVASADVVGMQGLSDAIACRRSKRASCWFASKIGIFSCGGEVNCVEDGLRYLVEKGCSFTCR